MSSGALVERTCARCGQQFIARRCQLKRGRGRFCSRTCQIQTAQEVRWATHQASVSTWFWEQVQKAGPDECWLWAGRRYRRGYGRFVLKGKQIAAHRMALSLSTGKPLSTPLLACHSCDNPPCCNPRHLWWGTDLDNTRDMLAKGRRARVRKFDRGSAATMLSSGMTYSAIARAFGVHHTSVRRALRALAAAGSEGR